MYGHAVHARAQAEMSVLNPAGLCAAAALLYFGAVFGGTLFDELFSRGAETLRASCAGAAYTGLPLLPILLFAVLPALLYGCVMLLCAYSLKLLPLWGAAELLAGMRCGMLICLSKAISALWLSALYAPALLLQGWLALLSLSCMRKNRGADSLLPLERFLGPATAYLALASALQTAAAALLLRALAD